MSEEILDSTGTQGTSAPPEDFHVEPVTEEEAKATLAESEEAEAKETLADTPDETEEA